MRQIHHLFVLVALFTSSMAFGQISEDPEERRDQGQSPLKSQTPTGEPLPFKQRLRFGGGISGLSFGNPFSIGVSPVVAYQVSEHFVAGLGVGYTYSRERFATSSSTVVTQKANQYSGRIFGMYEFLPSIVPNLFAHVELDQRSFAITQDGASGKLTGSSTATWLGATYSQPIGRLFAANLSALYNVSYTGSRNDQLLYGNSPFTIRILFF